MARNLKRKSTESVEEGSRETSKVSSSTCKSDSKSNAEADPSTESSTAPRRKSDRHQSRPPKGSASSPISLDSSSSSSEEAAADDDDGDEEPEGDEPEDDEAEDVEPEDEVAEDEEAEDPCWHEIEGLPPPTDDNKHVAWGVHQVLTTATAALVASGDEMLYDLHLDITRVLKTPLEQVLNFSTCPHV
ncbi:hypothetical protein EJ08DRAFT_699079 [Tothia fuscella]|uniref:Uncharacterized protein n=1 Tax=Tothia fuscella TaxID=1048955 RepID=A0A9P4NNA7_9PEZI|nr:hypothetical protein EJ08DRAFT_699079 [Tothia fuscella]